MGIFARYWGFVFLLTVAGCGGMSTSGGGAGGGNATVSLVVHSPDPTATGTSKAVFLSKSEALSLQKNIGVSKSSSTSSQSSVNSCTLTISSGGVTEVSKTASVGSGASEVSFSIDSLSSGTKDFAVECVDSTLTNNNIKSGFTGNNSGTIASSGNSTVSVTTDFLNFINDGTSDSISIDIESARCYQPDASNTECIITLDAALTDPQKDAVEIYIEMNSSGTAGSNGIVDAKRTDASRCGLARDKYFKITQSGGLPVAELFNSNDTSIMRATASWGTADNGNTNITVSLSHKQMKSNVDSNQDGRWCAVSLADGGSDAVPNSGSAKLDFSASTVSQDVSATMIGVGFTCSDNGDCGTGLCNSDTSLCLSVPAETAKPMMGQGNGYTCVLLINGTVNCWGNNAAGQLGRGTVNTPAYSVVSSSVLQQDGSLLTGAVELAVGGSACVRMATTGEVMCWGGNDTYGGLGLNGNVDGRTAPTALAYPSYVIDASTGHALVGATSVVGGGGHTCVVVNGGAKCFGHNAWGQSGTGSYVNWPDHVVAATNVVGLGAGSGVTKVALGDYHSCALLSNGTVECWGWECRGSLGRGAATDCPNQNDRKFGTADFVVTSLGANATYDSGAGDDTKLTGVTDLWAGGYSACAKKSDGTVLCWGRNSNYQLGDGTATHRSLPVESTMLKNATQISINELFSCAMIGGSPSCWGWNARGNLGLGAATADKSTLQAPLVSSKVVQINAAHFANYSTCVLLASGDVQCWGQNDFGQLGNGATTVNGAEGTAGSTPGFVSNTKGKLGIR